MWFSLIGLVLSAVSAGVSYSNSRRQAKQAEAVADWNAKTARNEAEQERLNRLAEHRAETDVQRRRRAAAEAAYLRSGVLIEGTPEAALSEQAGMDEMGTAQADLASRWRGLGIAARGGLARYEGYSLAEGYRGQGTASALGTAGNAAMMYGSWLNTKKT